MTGHKLYEFIRNDPELIGMIRQGLIGDRVRRGRWPGMQHKASREFERFWSSQHASRFRMVLERKLGVDLAKRIMRGGEARIRSAMILIVNDVLRELEQEG